MPLISRVTSACSLDSQSGYVRADPLINSCSQPGFLQHLLFVAMVQHYLLHHGFVLKPTQMQVLVGTLQLPRSNVVCTSLHVHSPSSCPPILWPYCFTTSYHLHSSDCDFTLYRILLMRLIQEPIEAMAKPLTCLCCSCGFVAYTP